MEDKDYNVTYTKVYSYKNMNLYLLLFFLIMFIIYIITVKYNLN